MTDTTIHGTAVLFKGAGILLRGPSQSGKSDLALRLIYEGGALIADDRVILEARDGRLEARPPEPLAGKLEVRGCGIIQVPYCAPYPLHLSLDLQPANEIPRLPEWGVAQFNERTLPSYRFDPFLQSALSRICVLLDTVSQKNEMSGENATKQAQIFAKILA